MQHLVARINYITPNGTFQTIGKVQADKAYYFKPGNGGETITSGDFEVLTCQPREPVIQCGTLLQYTANDITKLGFNSGIYEDGSVLYPGTGDIDVCSNQNPSPARLTNNLQKPGAFMQCTYCNWLGFNCNAKENYDEVDPRFFAQHDRLRWVMTTGSTYSTVPGAIKVGSSMYVGRVNVTTSNGTYQQIAWSWNLFIMP